MKNVQNVQDALDALRDSLDIKIKINGNMISSIPPITSTGRPRRGLPPSSPNFTPKKNRPNKYYKKPINTVVNMPTFNGTLKTRDVQLDIFDETEEKLEIVGDFPGITNISDIVVQMMKNELFVITKPNIERKYMASVKLPEAFKYKISSMEVKNGIMTMVMEKVNYKNVPELESIFQECLNKFPELSHVGFRVIESRRSPDRDSLDGAMGKANGEDVVILFVPSKLWGHWEAFRPIIYHELSHHLNLEEPDKVFYERADEKSIKLWDMLKENNVMECKVERKEDT
ncbi:hypothetical protein KKH23_10805 [Patescibacteria group bacterium]|nr:hypothetical protein [Patescibacteria group bacterium]